MRLLDAFCGGGGAGMGYHQTGFDIVGIDIKPQPHYPFKFIQADALEFIATHGHEFDVIHASPPCQAYSITKSLSSKVHPDLVKTTREAIQATGKPYIIENVPGAPLINPITLCGTMFNLRVIRHRLFETSPVIYWPPHPCQHAGKTAPIFAGDLRRQGHTGGTKLNRWQYITVSGANFTKADASTAMAINWMTSAELAQAIPPAYTRWLGRQLVKLLQ